MSGARPFRDVKLQWLQQLSCDRDLSDSARSVALYIITTHLNGHTEKAWPVARIRNLIAKQEIRHVRIGGSLFLPENAVDEYLAANMVEPKQKALALADTASRA